MVRQAGSVRGQVIAAWALFAAGAMAGAWANLLRPEVDPGAVTDRLAAPMLPWYEVFAINGGVALQLAGGFFTAGVLSALWTSLFGFDVASTVAALVREGAPARMIAAGMLPHGIVEVPALVSAGAAGLGGAAALFHEARDQRAAAKQCVRRSINLFTAALVLLVVAAALEVWLTPWVLRQAL